MRRSSAVALSLLLMQGWAQQLPPRDDPLYTYLVRVQPTPATLLRTARSADEWLNLLADEPSSTAQFARWKLNAEPELPTNTVLVAGEVQAFAFPRGSEWRTAEGIYRVVSAWAISRHALLEVVVSDARRRAGVNPSAFGTVTYTALTLQTGTPRWQLGYSTLRWAGGYSGSLLVNDESPPVPHASVQLPVRIPLLGTWRFEQFLSQFEQDGAPTWWGARRAERDFGTRWTLMVAEAFKALELPNGALSQIVPYYLYQRWFSTAQRGSGWFNYLVEVGVVYKPDAQNRVYLFWLIDDLRAPTALGGAPITPRKVAVLIGARLHPAPNTRLILEWARSDGTLTGGVYDASGHTRRYAYYYKDLPLGHPIGANRIGFYARAEHQQGRWFCALDYATLRRFHAYRPGERGFTLELLIGYQATERSILSVHYRVRHLRNDGAPDRRAGWYLQATAHF
ncbi:MAG: capsule assembly Wzi family protein [Fimbriimonadales bacterium]|nr:capsule assembly Wzi family protein [Fimbriimonadales bacterium]